MWSLRKRADLDALPDHRVVVRFEFSGVPASSTKFRIMWLVLERSGVDVCLKDPGFVIDLIFRGNVRDLVAVCLGHVEWRDVAENVIADRGRPQARKTASRLATARQDRRSGFPHDKPGRRRHRA
jgi:hypothetical protein